MAVALLLGARGFLGRNVVSALRAAPDFRLIEADLAAVLSTQGAESDRVVPLDLLGDPNALAAELARTRPDVIVNCVGRTTGDERQMRAANVEAVERLLAAIRGADGRPRLIHIGSAAEYGVARQNVLVTEDAETLPAAAYGETKLAGTRLVTEARARGEVDGVVLRLFNAVGPGMPADTLPGAALQRLAAVRAAGLSRVEMGPLDAVRDFVDVRDIAAAILAAAHAPSLPPAVVNIGTGRPSTARALVEAIARRVGYTGEIAETVAGSARSGSVSWMVADVSVAERELRWHAVHDLDSMADALVAGSAESGPGA